MTDETIDLSSHCDRAEALAAAHEAGNITVEEVVEFVVDTVNDRLESEGCNTSVTFEDGANPTIKLHLPDRAYPTVVVDSAHAAFYANFDGEGAKGALAAIESVANRIYGEAVRLEERYQERQSRELARKAPQAA